MGQEQITPEPRRRRFPWLVLLIGGILLLVAALLFSNRGRGNRGGTPAIYVDPQSIDLGDLKIGTDVSFTIKVTNTGTGELHFQKPPYIEVVEGC